MRSESFSSQASENAWDLPQGSSQEHEDTSLDDSYLQSADPQENLRRFTF